jgi:hypothetical protein
MKRDKIIQEIKSKVGNNLPDAFYFHIGSLLDEYKSNIIKEYRDNNPPCICRQEDYNRVEPISRFFRE